MSRAGVAASIAAADGRLLAELDAALAAGACRAGTHLVCRPGCTDCCHGPFPINALDAWRLGQGLAALATSDPARASALVQRAAAQRDDLLASFPGDANGRLADDEPVVEAFLARWTELPCPVLDSATGRCDLYAWRPLACRTYGLPGRVHGDDLPPCTLCFLAASPVEVEACRVEIDPEAGEDRLLDELEAGGPPLETLIAFALARK